MAFQQAHSWLARVVAIETATQTDSDQTLLFDDVWLQQGGIRIAKKRQPDWLHLIEVESKPSSMDDIRLTLKSLIFSVQEKGNGGDRTYLNIYLRSVLRLQMVKVICYFMKEHFLHDLQYI